jgi:hydrogenase expression/formation protein HypC
MCLAIPAKLVALLANEQAIVDVGDYVIVHVGHAIGRIDPEEAARTLALFDEMAKQVNA